MASPNLTEIVTTTLQHRNKELADNVSKGNALLTRLNAKGMSRPVPGGRTIVEELEYAENATFMYYSGYELLNISPSDVFSAAEYDWKQAAVVVTASGLETDVMNAGPDAVIPLLEKRIQNAERTMKNKISQGIYSDGTGTGGKQITGLRAQIADAPGTGVVGGIDRANFSFWRNQYKSKATIADNEMVGLMEDTWILCTRGGDKPDLIVADAIMYKHFWNALTPIQRITDANTAKQGWENLAFLSAQVVYDGDSGILTKHMYFLNTDYIYWRPHSKRNMVPLDRRSSVNQDALVVPIVFAGNLTCSNCSLQGVLFDSA